MESEAQRLRRIEGLKVTQQMPAAPARGERELLERNRRFYDSLWSGARLVEPHRFNTWPLVCSLARAAGRRLEVGPGLRPRLPIEGTQFVDISAAALAALRARGGAVAMSELRALPFADAAFDLVCALDIIEHVDDDEGALAELARVAQSGAVLLISVPLYAARWTAFDDFVGHKRRYEPAELLAKLARHRFAVERSCVFGMQPPSSRLVDLGMWWLSNHRDQALWWYNRALMPLGLRMQKVLHFDAGMVTPAGADEVLLVCRRTAR
ncbi:MAG: methyltransferase domain-containing protein [Caldimonas sp.]